MARTASLLTLLLMAFGLGLAPAARAADTYGVNAPGNVIVNTQVTVKAASLTTNLLSDRISQAVNVGVSAGFSRTGAGAGTQTPISGTWATLGSNDVKDSGQDQGFRGLINTIAGGVDHWVNNRLLIGVAGGYEHVKVDTSFNNGTLRSRGFAVSPYMAYQLTPNVTVDAIVGQTWLGYDEAHPGATGSFDASRQFGAVDVNARWKVRGWDVNTSGGYLYVTEHQRAYAESNGNLVAASTPHSGQIRATVGVSRDVPTTWGAISPFAYARAGHYVDQGQLPIINASGARANFSDWTGEAGVGLVARYGDRTTVRLEGSAARAGSLRDRGVSLTVRTQF